MPQAPQLLLSLVVFTQAPLHCEKPALQVVPHWLLTHVAVALGLVEHFLSQVPQFSGSVLVLAQLPLHLMYGELQEKSQTLMAHSGVALLGGVQTVAQSPQCAELLVRSTHEPSQLVVPPAHTLVHLPRLHTSEAPQAVAQSPQCEPSDVRSTHSPVQFV